MIRKIIVCLVAATFLVVGSGSSDEFSSTSYDYANAGQMLTAKDDEFNSTWYGYLNPGQMPTLTNIKAYYNSFGSYPTLSDEQFTYIVNHPC
jgi:hypothetical protein